MGIIMSEGKNNRSCLISFGRNVVISGKCLTRASDVSEVWNKRNTQGRSISGNKSHYHIATHTSLHSMPCSSFPALRIYETSHLGFFIDCRLWPKLDLRLGCSFRHKQWNNFLSIHDWISPAKPLWHPHITFFGALGNDAASSTSRSLLVLTETSGGNSPS